MLVIRYQRRHASSELDKMARLIEEIRTQWLKTNPYEMKRE
jgi:hypothetical protein